jgi:hypothetical protein
MPCRVAQRPARIAGLEAAILELQHQEEASIFVGD